MHRLDLYRLIKSHIVDICLQNDIYTCIDLKLYVFRELLNHVTH